MNLNKARLITVATVFSFVTIVGVFVLKRGMDEAFGSIEAPTAQSAQKNP